MEPEAQSSESRFIAYVDALAAVLGREDRAQPLRDYCTGLLMPGERKSVEPIAAVVAPARVSAKHQSLHDAFTRASSASMGKAGDHWTAVRAAFAASGECRDRSESNNAAKNERNA